MDIVGLDLHKRESQLCIWLEQYHSMNSSMACRQPRYASVELRLFSTADSA